MDKVCLLEVSLEHGEKSLRYLDIDHAESQYRDLIDAWQSFLETGTPKIHHLMDDIQTKISIRLEKVTAVEFGDNNDVVRTNTIRFLVQKRRDVDFVERAIDKEIKGKTGF